MYLVASKKEHMLAKMLFSLLKPRSSVSIILEDGAPFARPFVLLLLTLKSRSKNAPRTCQLFSDKRHNFKGEISSARKFSDRL
jgi:hypothetical protein